MPAPDRETRMHASAFWRALQDTGSPAMLRDARIPAGLRVMVLAPHPDDFDAAGVTLRFLHRSASTISVAVISSGASGVEAGFCDPSARAALREEEQRRSVGFFGLLPRHLAFLRASEDAEGHPESSAANQAKVHHALDAAHPDVVILPHGNDTNAGHRRVFAMLERWIESASRHVLVLRIKDPKTISMVPDVYTCFDGETAHWKRELLRFHASQQQRNFNQRGHGFDDRILDLNRTVASDELDRSGYAEAFASLPCHLG